jgi:predicted nucleic acid-binding protein
MIGYVDSSCLISIALGEPGSRELEVRLSRIEKFFSSNLLEAEFRAVLAREETRGRVRNLLALVNWVYPRRRLTPEIDQILGVGILKGADLWHLACALSIRPKMEVTHFLTLDGKQSDIAKSLGFRIL